MYSDALRNERRTYWRPSPSAFRVECPDFIAILPVKDPGRCASVAVDRSIWMLTAAGNWKVKGVGLSASPMSRSKPALKASYLQSRLPANRKPLARLRERGRGEGEGHAPGQHAVLPVRPSMGEKGMHNDYC